MIIYYLNNLYLTLVETPVGYFALYLMLMLVSSYWGSKIRKSKYKKPISIFSAILGVTHIWLNYGVIANFVPLILFTSPTWGRDFEGKVFSKSVLMTAVFVMLLNFSLTWFVFNTFREILSSNVSDTVVTLTTWLLLIFSMVLSYVVIRRFMPSRRRLVDVVLAACSVLIMPQWLRL